jgi:outer membrane protein OmpA-like peptidoglycan-associated protein
MSALNKNKKIRSLLPMVRRSAAHRSLLAFFMLFLLVPGCAGVGDTVVLVPDSDGKVGRVTVTTNGGTSVLTVANTMVEAADTAKSPSEPRALDRGEIDRLFQSSSNALPLQPSVFLFYFLRDSTDLTAESKALTSDVAAAVKSRDYCDISIIGHTDTVGNDEYNMKLSSARAQVVRDALVSGGVPSGPIELSYHGKRDPVVQTGDNVSEPRNRRVEVVVK